MPARWLLLCGVAPTMLVAGTSAQASETTTYAYDALGRLVITTRTGGPSSGVTMATCFDSVGNRSQYFVGTSGAPSCAGPAPAPAPAPTPTPSPTPTPTPTPTSSNLPPIAVADSLNLRCWTSATVNLTANDSDPDNNVPLALVSITGGSDTVATVISSTSVRVEAGDKGTATFTYVVRDSLGASSTGALTVQITGPVLVCSGGGGLQ